MRVLWRLRTPIVLCVALVAAGCAQPPMQQKITEFNRDVHEPRILLMPVDIQLSELTAGGLQEPKADWTDAAKQHVVEVLREEQTKRGNSMIEFQESAASVDDDVFQEISKLHGVVGGAILLQSLPNGALPTKTKFDWSLGPDVQKLKGTYDADYALFIFIRDSYSSGGRTAVIVLGALLGAAVPGGVQIGYASLVDLKTGDIVWFNRLARTTGDLRTKEPAQETVRTLLTGLPQ